MRDGRIEPDDLQEIRGLAMTMRRLMTKLPAADYWAWLRDQRDYGHLIRDLYAAQALVELCPEAVDALAREHEQRTGQTP